MTDTATATAFDPAAPSDEQFDAQAEIQRLYRPLASELIPAPAIQAVIDQINSDLDAQTLAKAKIVRLFADEQRGKGQAMQSVWVDKYQIYAHGDFFERPSPIGLESLRAMVDQTPILSAIINTRVRQIGRFCSLSEDGGMGFTIRHVDREHQITPDEQVAMRLLERFFINSGWEFNPRQRRLLRRDNFLSFIGKLVRDTLSMDAAAIETVYKTDHKRGIDGLHAVDGATIRLCTDEGYEGNERFFAVQVIQGQVRTAYTLDDLIFEPRNPRADVRLAGYGMGETELLLRVVTGFLNAFNLNIRGFSESAIPRGILQLCGDYSQEDLVAFKRYWNQMVKGVNNAWTVPVLVSKDKDSKAELTPLQNTFDEMYFSKWMTFLASIACAIYSMSPDEINFESFSAQRSSLSGNDTEQKLADSKDKGLKPLLTYFENLFTDFIVADFCDRYAFRWVGLDERDAAQEWEAKKLILTWNELRAEQGYDAIQGKLGNIPMNPALIGPWMQENMQQQPDFGGGAPPWAQPGQDQKPGQDEVEDEKGQDQGNQKQTPPQNPPRPAGPIAKALPTIYSLD